MNNENKDEIIEELWRIKDNFSSSCKNNVDKFINEVNKIAQQNGFHGEQINHRREKIKND